MRILSASVDKLGAQDLRNDFVRKPTTQIDLKLCLTRKGMR